MPEPIAYQVTKFGTGSTKTLATRTGATLAGIWISTKGANPTLTVYAASASVTGQDVIPATIVGTLGWWAMPPAQMGGGLTVKTASMTGTIFWKPAS